MGKEIRFEKEYFETLYRALNRRKFVHPDPLEFLYGYESPADREIAGFIASSLAFGRVSQILKSVSFVLEKMGETPHAFAHEVPPRYLHMAFRGFRHRWVGEENIVGLIRGIGKVLRKHESLNALFLSCMGGSAENIVSALQVFSARLWEFSSRSCSGLVPVPGSQCAYKRINLFLRWMVREDEVDPGGWTGVNPGALLYPVDTHLHRLATHFGITARRQADLRTAIEITDFFREIAPQDPVRYDFCLTRLGIAGEKAIKALPVSCFDVRQ